MSAATRLWSKSWREHWRDEKSDDLDVFGVVVRHFLRDHVGRVDEDGTGWATTEDGGPVGLARIALRCKATLEQARAALDQLRAAGVVVEVDGQWGTRGWATTQEDPEAKRKREYRERIARDKSGTGDVAVPGHVPSMPRDSDGPGTPQRTEDRGTEDRGTEEQNTPREAAPPVPVPGLQLVPAPLARAPRTRRQAANPGPEVARIFAAWQAARVELGLVEQPAALMSSSHAADIARPGDGEEDWLKVLRRAAENLRRDAQDAGRPARECKGAQFFTLESLARPANRQRFLDQPFLDQPRSAQARASPRPGRGAVRVEPVAEDVREEIRVFGGGDGT